MTANPSTPYQANPYGPSNPIISNAANPSNPIISNAANPHSLGTIEMMPPRRPSNAANPYGPSEAFGFSVPPPGYDRQQPARRSPLFTGADESEFTEQTVHSGMEIDEGSSKQPKVLAKDPPVVLTVSDEQSSSQSQVSSNNPPVGNDTPVVITGGSKEDTMEEQAEGQLENAVEDAEDEDEGSDLGSDLGSEEDEEEDLGSDSEEKDADGYQEEEKQEDRPTSAALSEDTGQHFFTPTNSMDDDSPALGTRRYGLRSSGPVDYRRLHTTGSNDSQESYYSIDSTRSRKRRAARRPEAKVAAKKDADTKKSKK
jgi:hypothetical protein